MPSDRAATLAIGAEAEYWDGLFAGELRLQRCGKCRKWHWPAVFRCADCGSWDHVWEAVSLHGTIYSWTRTWHPFGGLEALDKPFVIAVVQLNGGGGARLAGIMNDAGDVRIGQSVQGSISSTPFAGGDIPAIRWSA